MADHLTTGPNDHANSEPERTPSLEDLTKATGRIKRVNPDTGEPEPDPVTGESTVPKLTLSPSKAANAISSMLELRLSSADSSDRPKIWWYDGGIWNPGGEKQIMNIIYAAIGDLAYEKGVRETLHNIRARTEQVSFDQNPYLFPALDGKVDLKTGIFRENRPEDYLTFKYGASYDNPKADYSPFLWFLATSLPDIRDCLTVIDIITAVGLRIPFDIIVLLFGPGGNGKRVLEMLLIALYTMNRTAAMKLDEVKKSHFAAGNLLNKDLWIVSEVSSAKDVMDFLKGISSGDFLDGDVKYGNRVQGFPHVVPILDANKTFALGDNTEGRKRRFVKMDFPYTFGYKSTQRPKDPHLAEKLSSPEVLSGVLQIVAARAPILAASKKIYLRKSAEQMDQEFSRQREHLRYFCEECLSKEAPEKPERLTSDVLQAEYGEYCRLFNVTEPASNVALGRYISEQFGITRSNTSELDENKKKVNISYYPDLWLIKLANDARTEALAGNEIEYLPPKDVDDLAARYGYYKYYSNTTDILQMEGIENNSSSSNTTDTTDNTIIMAVIEELWEMYTFVQGCDNPQEISYTNFLAQKSVVSVVSNAGDTPICSNSVVYV
jgi:phage/plasmid-associated DNA primase